MSDAQFPSVYPESSAVPPPLPPMPSSVPVAQGVTAASSTFAAPTAIPLAPDGAVAPLSVAASSAATYSAASSAPDVFPAPPTLPGGVQRPNFGTPTQGGAAEATWGHTGPFTTGAGTTEQQVTRRGEQQPGRARAAFSLTLLSLALIILNLPFYPFLTLGVAGAMSVLAWMIAPGTLGRRFGGLGLGLAGLLAGSFGFGLLIGVFGFQDTSWILPLGLSCALVLGGWLVVRHRRGLTALFCLIPLMLTVPVVLLQPIWNELQYRSFRFDGSLYWLTSLMNVGPALLLVITLGFIAPALLSAKLPAIERNATVVPTPAPQFVPLQTADGQTVYVQATNPAGATNSLAIAALISVFFVSLLGIVLGHVALSQIRTTGQQGRGLALTAVIIGYCSIALTLLGLLAYFGFIAAMIARL